MLVALCVPNEMDTTGGLGTNGVSDGYESYQALFGEIFGTFMLVYTVLETAVNPATKDNRLMAAVAIGLSVYLSHCVLLPIDGCSINPTRSFGPAVVASVRYDSFKWDDQWIFWLGPIL